MACDCCKSLDFESLLRKETPVHHQTLEELTLCASSGDCALCEWIKCAIEEDFQKILANNCDESRICYRNPSWVDIPDTETEGWYGISEVEFYVSDMPDFEGRLVLGVFVAQGSRLATSGVISGRPIAQYGYDDGCFQLARKWRDTCFNKHILSCLQPMKRPLPTRVIDVSPIDGPWEPLLKVTGCEEGEWVALSHCWGTKSRFVTVSSNIEASMCSIPLQDMPPTFQDAVYTTRQLGYRYLWIDSLCIIQDDHQDWVAESTRMREYYKHAAITISCDSASGDDVGFLKHERKVETLSVDLSSNDEDGFRRQVKWPKFQKRDTFISERAWTLQEFVLSPRSLSYTSQQIVWECHTRKYCESRENSLEDSPLSQLWGTKRFFLALATDRQQVSKFGYVFHHLLRWYNLVNDYRLRDLTYGHDILPAISGIAREIRAQAGGTYLAGIWLEDIHRGLMWAMGGAGKIPETYHAPSWSWASLQISPDALDTVHFLYWMMRLSGTQLVERRATLLSHEIVAEDNDMFGCIRFGYLHLRGSSLLASKWQGSYKGRLRTHFHQPIHLTSNQLIFQLDVFDEKVEPLDVLANALLFQISSWKWDQDRPEVTLALLLVKVGDQPIETYRRVGMAEVPNVDGLAEEGWEMRDIRII